MDTKARRFPKPEVLQDIISFATNTDTPIADVVPRRYPYFEPLTGSRSRASTASTWSASASAT